MADRHNPPRIDPRVAFRNVINLLCEELYNSEGKALAEEGTHDQRAEHAAAVVEHAEQLLGTTEENGGTMTDWRGDLHACVWEYFGWPDRDESEPDAGARACAAADGASPAAVTYLDVQRPEDQHATRWYFEGEEENAAKAAIQACGATWTDSGIVARLPADDFLSDAVDLALWLKREEP